MRERIPFLGRRGMTLMQLLVTGALAGTLGLVIFQVSNIASGAAKGLEVRRSIRTSLAYMSTYLSKNANCFSTIRSAQSTIGGLLWTLPETAPTKIGIFEVGTRFGENNAFEITAMNFAIVGGHVPNVNQGLIEISLDYRYHKNSFIGGDVGINFTRYLHVFVRMDGTASPTVIGCKNVASIDHAGFCAGVLNGSWDALNGHCDAPTFNGSLFVEDNLVLGQDPP